MTIKTRHQTQIRSIDANGRMQTIIWRDMDYSNVKDFLAKGDGVTDDTVALQTAINTVISKGGGVIKLPPGNFLISAPLLVNMGAALINVSIEGSGNGVTTITQSQVTQDIFQIGQVSQEYADNLRFSDFDTVGGNYAFNLTNSLKGTYENITITSPKVGLFLRGSNERHIFRNIEIDSATLNGISTGNSNGTLGVGPLDIPETQKCRFEKIRINNTIGGSAIVVSSAGGVAVSLHNVFSEILLEGNLRGGIELDYCGNTTFHMVTNEAFDLDTNNAYSIFLVQNESGPIVCTGCSFQGAESGNQYQYLINVQSGDLSLNNCTMSGASAVTADVFTNNAIHIFGGSVNAASSVVFGTNAAQNQSSLINVRDGGDNLLAWTEPFIGYIGDTTPRYLGSNLTGSVNNWAPTTIFLGLNPNGRTNMWWSATNPLAVTGLVPSGAYGQEFTFVNDGTAVVTFAHNSGSSTAGNRFSNFCTSAPTPVAPGGSASWIYDGNLASWKMVFHEQGQWITPGFSAANYSGNGGMTWTVTSGEVNTQRYRLSGNTLTVAFDLSATTVGGTPGPELIILNGAYGSFNIASKVSNSVGLGVDNNSTIPTYCQVNPAAGQIIKMLKTGGGNWSASTNLTSFAGQITFEVS